MAEEGRVAIKAQKARSDTMFLMELLLGGPMMAIGGNVRPGLLVVFGAGLASVIRRYSGWSTMGAVVARVAFVGALTDIGSAIYARFVARGISQGSVGSIRPRRFAVTWPNSVCGEWWWQSRIGVVGCAPSLRELLGNRLFLGSHPLPSQVSLTL